MFVIVSALATPASIPSSTALASTIQPPISVSAAKPITIGKPVRIVVPASGIDLPVDEGYFDPATQAWSLSGYRAQFATISTLANDQAGDTFIYGHNNNYVFGALRHRTPDIGAQALVYTDNGHIFSYIFHDVVSVGPHDTGILVYQGAPRLTIQTCTGPFDELRTLFHFSFERVVQ